MPPAGLSQLLLSEPAGLCIGRVAVKAGGEGNGEREREREGKGACQHGAGECEEMLGVLAEPWVVEVRVRVRVSEAERGSI